MSQEQSWRLGRTDDLPDGPWKDEPDKIQWIDGTTGLDCLIVRNRMGGLCGYVGVPPGHPWHGRGYDELDVSVHGGLTFASGCDEDNPEGICHVPAPGRPADVWWLGFDCGHAYDLQPRMELVLSRMDPPLPTRTIAPGWEVTYRTVDYVRAECTDLAWQLQEVAG